MNQGVVMPCRRNKSAVKIVGIQIGITTLFEKKKVLQDALIIHSG
jgi:hypothetical protein